MMFVSHGVPFLVSTVREYGTDIRNHNCHYGRFFIVMLEESGSQRTMVVSRNSVSGLSKGVDYFCLDVFLLEIGWAVSFFG